MVDPPAAPHPKGAIRPRGIPASYSAPVSPARPRGHPEELEPRRQRRLSRERDPIEARIDLHGYGRFQAQDALTPFWWGSARVRSVLVIPARAGGPAGVLPPGS